MSPAAAWWRVCSLADQVQHPVAAQRLGVILDPDGSRLGGAQRVDAEQVGQGAMVDADGLGDLEESDQLEPVQAPRVRDSSRWTVGRRA